MIGIILMMFSLPRWRWLTDRWYPAEWSRGWMGLAGAALALVGAILFLRYRESSPYTDNDETRMS